MPVTTDTRIEVSHKGDVRKPVIDRATDKITRVAEICRERVGHVEIRLMMEANPARERPAIAEATLDVDGQPVRARIAEPTMDEAIDALVDRLRRRIKRHEERRHRLAERHRTGDSGPGEWRHGDLAPLQADYVDIPFDEREVRRHKTFALEPIMVEEALFDLEQLGHEFYLFVEETTGADAVVRAAADEYELRIAGDATVDPDPALPVASVRNSPPVLTLAEAKEHLEASGDRHVFFVSTETGRGNVLYRRFDGHYGLVTPT